MMAAARAVTFLRSPPSPLWPPISLECARLARLRESGWSSVPRRPGYAGVLRAGRDRSADVPVAPRVRPPIPVWVVSLAYLCRFGVDGILVDATGTGGAVPLALWGGRGGRSAAARQAATSRHCVQTRAALPLLETPSRSGQHALQ
jgi:hypothetical protein